MKDKMIKWLSGNKKLIGYITGTAGILCGIMDIVLSNYVFGVFWLFLGSLIIYDARSLCETH